MINAYARLCIRFCLAFYIPLTPSIFTSVANAASTSVTRPVLVVAAENVYGEIARQIGGARVQVRSAISTPAQDPHLFEPTPRLAREIADAQIVVFNGAGYDPWIESLLKAAPRGSRIVIDVAKLSGFKPGDNPHLWYNPLIMPKVAETLSEAFTKADPAHGADYRVRLETTLAGLTRVNQRVAQLKAKHAGTAVTATEAAFIPMANAIGLTMRNMRFQQAAANGTEPSARDLAAVETDLKERKVKALIYNKQVSERLSARLRDIALQAAVPVVSITETSPAGQTYEEWMLGTLEALDKALSE